MNLAKTSFLSLISTAVRMLAGLAINKAVALYVGPAGLAFVGQLQNFIQLVMAAGQGAINTGVTKYTAEYGKSSKDIPILFGTASKISLTCSFVVGGLVVGFSPMLSNAVLKSTDHTYIFVVFGFVLVFFVINSLLLSILNGLKEIKTFIAINIIQSIYSLIFTTLLIFAFGLDGALFALVTNQSVIFLVVIFMLRGHPTLRLSNFTGRFDGEQAKKLAKYSAMTMSSALSVPISHFAIRNYLGESLGWDLAGYWQAIWYISTMYIMVVTTALSIYYLPRLSEIKEKSELRRELIGGYRIILPIVCAMSLGLFLFKDFIIWILFTEDFHQVRDLFFWQLVGSIIKISAWLLAYIMLAKAMTKEFVLLEVSFSFSFFLMSVFLVNVFGLVGMTYAFAANYTLYLLVVYQVTKSKFSSAC